MQADVCKMGVLTLKFVGGVWSVWPAVPSSLAWHFLFNGTVLATFLAHVLKVSSIITLLAAEVSADEALLLTPWSGTLSPNLQTAVSLHSP
jgi:hypothetical protein